MFKTKSFNLITEEDLKKSEESSKCGWLRCLVIPALIAFMLTLILVNVDFSGEPCPLKSTTEREDLSSSFVTDHEFATETEQSNRAATQSDKNSVETVQTHEYKPVDTTVVYMELPGVLNTTELGVDSAQPENRFGELCTEKANVCTVVCSVFSDDGGLNKELEKQYVKCQADMEVTLQGATFKNSALGKNFLSGNFRIKILNLWNCILNVIDNNAFKKTSMEKMQKLVITSATVKQLTAQTFAGLEALTYFEMTNEETLDKLNANEFLKPMAQSLTHLVFKQSSSQKEFDATPWLSGADFIKLDIVSLNGNYFKDTLNSKSFATLVSVKRLELRNCRINYIAENTFSKVIETLENLDLGQNQLKTLSPDFLLSSSGNDVTVIVSVNSFDCGCANDEFVENIKRAQIIFETAPKCATPNRVYGEDIKNIKNCCENFDEQCPEETTTASTTRSTVSVTVTSTETETETVTEDNVETTHSSTEEITDTTSSTTKLPSDSDTELVCKSTVDDTEYSILIKKQYILFTLRIISPSSVIVELEMFDEEFQLIYFSSNRTEQTQSIEITAAATHIDDLIPSRDYIFCAIPPQLHTFSPLNCRSHYTERYRDSKDMAWLVRSDMPLFISLTTFGMALCLFLGALMVFSMLRWKPKLLKGSKRLLSLDTGSKQVFLSKDHTTLSSEELYEALRTYAKLYPNPSNNDYMQYFRHWDASSTIYTDINFTDNRPPAQRAPAMPPIERNRQLSAQSTIPASDTISLESISEAADEHEYQSLEEYQEIYEINLAQKKD